MHSSILIAMAALASSALAVPMGGNNGTITTTKTSYTHSATPLSTTSSILTGVTDHNTTMTSHTTTSPAKSTTTSYSTTPKSNSTISTSTGHWRHHTKPASTTTFTTTEFITTTKFIPVSTPVATSHGTTFYSTFLTTEVYTRTSCYPVTSTIVASSLPIYIPPHPTTIAPACAAATITVTEYPQGAQGGYYRPGHCDTCQTITYTDVWGYIITMAVPTNPWHPQTATSTSISPISTTSSVKPTTPPVSSSTTHKTHPSGWTKSTTKPVGTGNLTGVTRSTTVPAGTGNLTGVTRSTTTSSTSISSIYGTGKVPSKAYPTGNWA